MEIHVAIFDFIWLWVRTHHRKFQSVKTLTDDLNKILPRQWLTNPKEVSGFIRKLYDLGPNINQINTNYIKKYGQKEYNSLIKRYLYDDITKKEVLSKLNSVKNVNIKIKPYFGKGADHVLI